MKEAIRRMAQAVKLWPKEVSSEKLPGHLMAAKSYNARNPFSVEQLLDLAKGKPVRPTRAERVASAYCTLFGHDLVLDRWTPEKGHNWFLSGNYEVHLGCRRCRYTLVLDPKETPESSQQQRTVLQKNESESGLEYTGGETYGFIEQATLLHIKRVAITEQPLMMAMEAEFLIRLTTYLKNARTIKLQWTSASECELWNLLYAIDGCLYTLECDLDKIISVTKIDTKERWDRGSRKAPVMSKID
jgi:hypothetical protein